MLLFLPQPYRQNNHRRESRAYRVPKLQPLALQMPSTSDTSLFAVSGLPFTCDGEYPATCKINYAMNTLLHFMVNTAEICYGYYDGTQMQYSTISGKELMITGTYFTT